MNNYKLPAIGRLLFSSHKSLPTQVLQRTNDHPPYFTSTTIATALQEYIDLQTPNQGQKIHGHLIKTGFRFGLNISIKILILYLKSGCLKYARQMFDELPSPTLSAYNFLVGGYLKRGKAVESLELVRKMCFSGEVPDGFTLSMVLKASSSDSNVKMPRGLGRAVHAQILRRNVEPDDVLYTALVDSYVKTEKVECARTVFDMMLEKNVVCSTSMITGYMNQGLLNDAEYIFQNTNSRDLVVYNAMIEGYSKSVSTATKAIEVYIEMQRADFRPDISSFASVIGACSVLTAFDVGQQIQSQLSKMDFYTHIKMGSSLLDMYAKCGRMEEARKVFDYMPEKNVFTWTSLIDGYGKNGNPDKALELFCLMQENNIEPNYVTFLGALTACAHAGLVDKGRKIFSSMEKSYSKPKMAHYACMVDLLGRAGSLDEACKFVAEMPEKPNSDVWAALLSSCRLHGDVEMASVAANELFKLNGRIRPGAYVALSNTFAAAGKWDSVCQLRDVMADRGIMKNTARSWSELGGAS